MLHIFQSIIDEKEHARIASFKIIIVLFQYIIKLFVVNLPT
jgi:hypothetical protein